jgi:hypothetical protein
VLTLGKTSRLRCDWDVGISAPNPYSYNTSNELTATPSGSYTYDNNGHTLTDPSEKSYTWDFEKRLVSVVVPGTKTVDVQVRSVRQ